MIDKDGGGGGQLLDFKGGHSCNERRLSSWGPPVPPLGKTLLWEFETAAVNLNLQW